MKKPRCKNCQAEKSIVKFMGEPGTEYLWKPFLDKEQITITIPGEKGSSNRKYNIYLCKHCYELSCHYQPNFTIEKFRKVHKARYKA